MPKGAIVDRTVKAAQRWMGIDGSSTGGTVHAVLDRFTGEIRCFRDRMERDSALEGMARGMMGPWYRAEPAEARVGEWREVQRAVRVGKFAAVLGVMDA